MELPYIFYGSSTDLTESLRIIEKMDLDTIIQGHGRPCNKAKVAEDRKYLEGLRKAVGESVQSGEPLEKLEKIPSTHSSPLKGSTECLHLQRSHTQGKPG